MLRKIFIGAVLLAALMVGVNHAQISNTASANINAELSLPIAIYSGMMGVDFGRFMPGAEPGTVVLPADPNSGRSATGGVILVGGYSEPGQLSVEGDPDATYQLTFTTEAVTLENGNEATMTMTNISTYSVSGQFKLDQSGYQNVYFGGTLNVAANQASGGYFGQFMITANYL